MCAVCWLLPSILHTFACWAKLIFFEPIIVILSLTLGWRRNHGSKKRQYISNLIRLQFKIFFSNLSPFRQIIHLRKFFSSFIILPKWLENLIRFLNCKRIFHFVFFLFNFCPTGKLYDKFGIVTIFTFDRYFTVVPFCDNIIAYRRAQTSTLAR